MKTSKIKNTISAVMLSVGILIQVFSPVLSNESGKLMQNCNKQLLLKLKQRVFTTRLLFGINQLPSNNHIENEE